MTGFTPFELFFGRLPTLPLDIFLPEPEQQEKSHFEILRKLETNCQENSRKVVERETKLRVKFIRTGSKPDDKYILLIIKKTNNAKLHLKKVRQEVRTPSKHCTRIVKGQLKLYILK